MIEEIPVSLTECYGHPKFEALIKILGSSNQNLSFPPQEREERKQQEETWKLGRSQSREGSLAPVLLDRGSFLQLVSQPQ